MTDPISAPGDPTCDSPALYSRTPTDERGNFAYCGDLLCSNETFAALCARIGAHLRDLYPDLQISLTRQSFAGGRKIRFVICDTSADLRDPAVRDPFLFAFARSNRALRLCSRQRLSGL